MFRKFKKMDMYQLEKVIFGGMLAFMFVGSVVSMAVRSSRTKKVDEPSGSVSVAMRHVTDISWCAYTFNHKVSFTHAEAIVDDIPEIQTMGMREEATDIVPIMSGMPIEINDGLFSAASVRLNKEIYDITDEVLMRLKSVDMAELGLNADKNYLYFLQHVNSLMVLAPLNTEKGNANDTAYTWTPAIYSKVLLENGVRIDSADFSVDSVNFDLFTMNKGLASQLMCGKNCSRLDGPSLSIGVLDGGCYESVGMHVQNTGSSSVNDNDSLGPLQILRRYLYVNGGTINYARYGEEVSDLMRWRDNVVYWYCERAPKIQSNALRTWFADYMIESEYELVVLLAISHNAGMSIFSRSSIDNSKYSRFNNVGEALEWVKFITDSERIEFLESYVDEWYEKYVVRKEAGMSFSMPGSDFDTKRGRERLAKLFGQDRPCSVDGLHTADCVTGEYIVGDACVFTGFEVDGQSYSGAHKAVYPIKALVDYMALVRLYTSGNEELAGAFGMHIAD